MQLRISSEHRTPFTRKEIMEEHHQDLWQKTEHVAEILLSLQKEVVALLPEAKKRLPKDVDELKEPSAQMNFLDYLYLRSLFGFAEGVWMALKAQCCELAETQTRDRYDDEKRKEAEEMLVKTLRVATSIPFVELPSAQEKKLEVIKEYLLCFDDNPSDFRVHKWTFKDIVECEKNNGSLMSAGLLRDTLADDFPIKPSIGRLLDDDKTILYTF